MSNTNGQPTTHPNPPEQFSQRPAKRPRVVVACLRCKARRQKCDNQSPACSNCARANLSCTFPENEYPPSYVKALEDRVAWLETSRHASQNSQTVDHVFPEGENIPTTRSEEDAAKMKTPPHLANSIGLLSLHAAAEPRYFGVSSGVSLAHMIETAVYEQSGPATDLDIPGETDNPFNTSSKVQNAVPMPSLEKGKSYIDAYVSYIHPNYPFISIRRLWRIHKGSQDLEGTETGEAELNYIALQLIYAIGARCLQLVGSPNASGAEPEGHYASAVAKVRDKFNVPSAQNIQIILLVAIYALRSPSGSSVWHLCGLMIRQCLELGLHKQLKSDEETLYSDEFKKRLFWSIYRLERRIALVLGRPFAICDDEIDAGFPLDIEDNIEDSFETATRRDRLIPNISEAGSGPSPRTSISIFVLLLQLDQLNTKSRLSLCRLAKAEPGERVERKIAKRFQELGDWKDAIFGSSAGYPPEESPESVMSTSRTPVPTPISQLSFNESERLTLLLGYHQSRRINLQTILTDIKRPGRTFEYSSFAKSSGEVCQLNRRLHRLKSIPFTLLDLHSIFVAGFSMIYCVWTNPELYDLEMAADFGACSVLLYVIAEQWPSAKKYRDAFELVAEKTLEFVSSAGRSGRGQPVISNQQLEYNGHISSASVAAPANDNLPAEMPQPYDMERTWGDDSVNFDVWQMMNQFVQTQDYSLQYDAVNLTGIESLLAEEGLGWFYGNPSSVS